MHVCAVCKCGCVLCLQACVCDREYEKYFLTNFNPVFFTLKAVTDWVSKISTEQKSI